MPSLENYNIQGNIKMILESNCEVENWWNSSWNRNAWGDIAIVGEQILRIGTEVRVRGAASYSYNWLWCWVKKPNYNN